MRPKKLIFDKTLGSKSFRLFFAGARKHLTQLQFFMRIFQSQIAQCGVLLGKLIGALNDAEYSTLFAWYISNVRLHNGSHF